MKLRVKDTVAKSVWTIGITIKNIRTASMVMSYIEIANAAKRIGLQEPHVVNERILFMFKESRKAREMAESRITDVKCTECGKNVIRWNDFINDADSYIIDISKLCIDCAYDRASLASLLRE